MFQLLTDGGAVATDDYIFTLVEEYGGRVSDIGDFEKFVAARGAWIGLSTDERLHLEGCQRLRRIFKKKDSNGLRKMIHTTGTSCGTWILRRLATREEHLGHLSQLYAGIRRDVESYNKEIDYHHDRWHVWPEAYAAIVLPEGDTPIEADDEDEE